MKRSTMIEYLNDLVGSGLCSDPEKILTLVEDLGMVPPMREKAVDCTGETYFIHTWDEESDD